MFKGETINTPSMLAVEDAIWTLEWAKGLGAEYGVEAYRLYLSIESIREIGVLLKDLDTGLLDFPHEREGRVGFLCWHPPEERVGFWHEIEAGYAGRRPL